MSQLTLALILTTLAGLSTTLGSLLGLVVRQPGPRFMAATLGFAAGVMILVSFVELLAKSFSQIGLFPGFLWFFLGFLGMMALDLLVPHSYLGIEDTARGSDARLLRTGLLVALGLGIHNFPEGMATLAGTLQNTRLGIAIAVAIAIHNIPEGLAVSAPIYAATGSRRKAFLWSFLSGVAEPVGAGIAALVLLPFLDGPVLGGLLAAVAGLMVFISLDELLPASREHGEEHLSILGVAAGMLVMAASLGLLARG
jgi:ZIP family zinc transporter